MLIQVTCLVYCHDLTIHLKSRPRQPIGVDWILAQDGRMGKSGMG